MDMMSYGQGSKPIPFFQFTTRLGEHILATQTAREPATAKVRHTYQVPHTIITMFWQKIWKQQHARKITMFQWLLIHKLLSVGAWQSGNLSSPNYVECPNAIESIWHVMWDCPTSHQIWRGVGRLLQLCQVQGSIKWGNICWLSWQTPIDSHEHQEEGMTLVIKAQEVIFSTIGNVQSTPLNDKSQVVLELVSPITLWIL